MNIAGRLRHRITIQRRVDSQDESGNQTVSWESLHVNVPAEIVALSAREFVSSQAMQSGVTTRIMVRALEGLDATMRIVHGSKIYNPMAWLPDAESGREYLTAPCTEGLNDGA